MTAAAMARWQDRWEAVCDAVVRLGGEAERLEPEPPARPKGVEKVERKLGRKLPDSFRRVLLDSSRLVSGSWRVPEEIALPEDLRGIGWGECRWGLENLTLLEEHRLESIKQVYPNPKDPVDVVYHQALLWLDIANGDDLGFALGAAADAPVVYLDHEGGKNHGRVLGENFADFMERWTRLGCPGPEWWAWERFLSADGRLLDPDSPIARRWRDVLGIRS
ncbi:MAG: SMI1/KNR4 family protein [Planctomycetales bacterium]|nr:SMI1/KNR4 family protein [Planctomycetales bacterium]